MQVSRSVNEAIADLAEALECFSQAMQIIAGELEEVKSRVEHIEEYLEGIDETEDEGVNPGILPCGYEGESEQRQKQLEEIDLSDPVDN